VPQLQQSCACLHWFAVLRDSSSLVNAAALGSAGRPMEVGLYALRAPVHVDGYAKLRPLAAGDYNEKQHLQQRWSDSSAQACCAVLSFDEAAAYMHLCILADVCTPCVHHVYHACWLCWCVSHPAGRAMLRWRAVFWCSTPVAPRAS
jgi:hypothetical protein